MLEKKLLTVKEAASELGLSRAFLYQLVLREEIPSLKIGRARRIPATALDAFIERRLREQGTSGF